MKAFFEPRRRGSDEEGPNPVGGVPANPVDGVRPRVVCRLNASMEEVMLGQIFGKLVKSVWSSGLTSASHAAGRGFDPQCVQ